MRQDPNRPSSRREFLERSAMIASGGAALLHSAARRANALEPLAILAGGADDVLLQFDPPGNLDDLDNDQKKRWSKFISDRMELEITGDQEGKRLQFYNPTKTATTADKLPAPISWT